MHTNNYSQLRIVMAQLNLLVGDVEGNVQKVIGASQQARDELQAHAIVFPELTLTAYPPEDLLLRPGLHVLVQRGLARLKQQIKGIVAIVGYPQQQENHLYNAAAVIQKGEIVAVYRKQHLPNYNVFDEKRYFTQGEKPCIVRINDVPIGITLCEDVWYPGPVMQAVDAGARIILNMNASPFHMAKRHEREAVVQARTAESAVPLVYVNLVGGQDELVFDGESFVVTGDGAITHRAPAFAEGLFEVDFKSDGTVVPPKQTALSVPLSHEESIYQALILGVRDYIEKNGFKGVVMGLSGGVDSALTLAIAVDAIGSERVEAVMLPSQYTAEMSIEDATAEAQTLGVEYHIIPIEPVYQAFLLTLKDEFAGTKRDTTEENLQARCRGVILMAISNKKRKIVLTTGNKSELAVGYATLYGDMAGGYDVLKDVPKSWVYRLAAYRNGIAPVIPQRVFDRPPSAELSPDQKDTDSLPPYDMLDVILEMYVEQDMGLEDIVTAGFDEDTVRHTIGMVNRNEYKRRQAPPGVRITRRAFGRDRRYPITSKYGKVD